jgi:DNA-binding GntR family transcriptional regulator
VVTVSVVNAAPRPRARTPEATERAPSVYEMIRDDIISGRVPANERLRVADLSRRYHTSNNPVREALQQLRGEGFVLMAPNRGARVRPIDEDFVRDIYEIEVLLEPALTRWFVRLASADDFAALEALHEEMVALDFADPLRHGDLDREFHHYMYRRHYNRHAVDLWEKHREVLRAIARRLPSSLHRRATVLREHRALLEAIKAHDEAQAAAVIAEHVAGSGKNIIEQMGIARRSGRTAGAV